MLLTGKSGLVGFWMSLQYSRYRGQVLNCMRDVLASTKLAMAVTDVDEGFRFHHSFDRALRVPVDGIIAFDNSASVEVFASAHARLAPNVPFVSMGAYWSEAQSFVGVDLRAGVEEAMDHLIASGRRRIAYMAPANSGLLTEGFRFDAYRDRMCAAGLEPSLIPTPDGAFHKIQESLEQHLWVTIVPEAILCMNDEIAIATAFVLQRMGLQVGRDVALVGIDGIEETAHCPIPITTVRQPIEEMCRLTWEFLHNQCENPHAPLQQKILRPELVVRASTLA